MSGAGGDLERRCAALLRAHLEARAERTRHAAYLFGRELLASGLGLLDAATLLLRGAAATAGIGEAGDADHSEAIEEFTLECLSPFEMAHRAAGEANAALRRLNEVREEEVKRIAHAIHDDAAQLLATVHWSLGDVERAAAPSDLARGIEAVRQGLRAVEERLRQISHELRPTILDDLGLVPALQSLGESVARRSGLAVVLEGDAGGRLPPEVETVLYRTVQEALRNAVKHAGASRVVVRLERTGERVSCSVRDDGSGFVPPAARPGGGSPGLGLIGMRERVAQVGGAVEIRTEPGHGTEIFVPIPLEARYAVADSTGR